MITVGLKQLDMDTCSRPGLYVPPEMSLEELGAGAVLCNSDYTYNQDYDSGNWDWTD